MEWIISLLTGAVGGNVAGAVLKKFSLGTIGNSIAGILGGAGGQSIMAALNGVTGNDVVDSLLGGGVGGGVVMVVIGLIRKVIGK
ncbi:MAG: hypothetical protein AAGA58_10695 [Verrucomicrobiota bacterium]